MSGKHITPAKRSIAAAMMEMGIPGTQVAAELGISRASAFTARHADDLQPELVAKIKAQIADRLVVASDRYLTASLDRIKELHPYQAMLCAGIAHDHYLRASAASRGDTGHGLTQILVLIDQRQRGSHE